MGLYIEELEERIVFDAALMGAIAEAQSALDGEWAAFSVDYENSNAVEDSSINVDTAPLLQKNWQTVTFDATPNGVTGTNADVAGHPAIADGVVFYNDAGGRVYAVDADDGSLIWQVTLPGEELATTPVITEDYIYVSDNFMTALDRDDGSVVWQTDLNTIQNPNPDFSPVNDYTGDAIVVGDLVIVGVASTQNYLQPGVIDYTARGSIVAMDRFTGDEVWRFFTTSDQEQPNPEFGGGAGVWSSPAVDLELGLLYIGVGQSYEPEASPFTDSLLALNIENGSLEWSYQFTEGDVWSEFLYPDGPDWDVGAHPNLFSIDLNDEGGKGLGHQKHAHDDFQGNGFGHEKHHDLDLVGVGDKAGNYHILNRVTGELLKTIELDPGSTFGGFQGSGAVADGVLYVASHAVQLEDGTRVSLDTDPNFFFAGSSKLVAIDIEKAINDDPDYLIWEDITPGLSIAPVTYVNGVLIHTTHFGTMRLLDASDATVLFQDAIFDLPGPVDVFSASAASIVGDDIYIGYGLGFGIGGVASYGLPDGVGDSGHPGQGHGKGLMALLMEDDEDGPPHGYGKGGKKA